jgi:protein SCO1/2
VVRGPVAWTTLVILLWCALRFGVCAQTLTSSQLAQIGFDQKLNSLVSLELSFRDETGKAVKLGDYFGRKPVVLVLGYYECPMLCTLTFNGMVESMAEIKWSIGDQFEVVHVSINPKETSTLAAAKKQTYLKRYGRPGAAIGWHFLTGDEYAIRQLAREAGFQYAFDPSIGQYAHPSGLIVLTPQGKIAKYLFGVKFSPNELYDALKTASESKVGSRIQQLVLLCFHYSPIKGKYGAAIMAVLRLLGAGTLLSLSWLLFSGIKGRPPAALAPTMHFNEPLSPSPGASDKLSESSMPSSVGDP